MKLRTIIFLLFISALSVNAQVVLKNSSFEGQPGVSAIPTDWVTCIPGSTPDILPGMWGVNKPAQDGMSYLGLITRENGSFESIGQRLPKALEANTCYVFSVYLARSESYVGYNLPLRLKIWGSKEYCGKDQLLVSTKTIKHTNWEKYEFQIYTKEKAHFLLFEACTAPGITTPYRGNILMDELSPITPCFKAENDNQNSNIQQAGTMDWMKFSITELWNWAKGIFS